MTRAGLIEKVKINLDEYTPEGVSLPLDDVIGPVLDESAREIIEKAPLHLLTPAVIPLSAPVGDPPVDTSIVLYEKDKAYIPVPADYVRLYEIMYPLWKRSVRKALPVESPAYKVQENEFLTPGYGRPFVGIVQTSVAGAAVKRYFECGKVEDPLTATLTPVATYVKTALPESLADSLADSLAWLTAAKVLLIMGYPDKAKTANEQFVQNLLFLGNS